MREREVLGRDEEKGTKREKLIEIEIDEELEREGEGDRTGNMKTDGK